MNQMHRLIQRFTRRLENRSLPIGKRTVLGISTIVSSLLVAALLLIFSSINTQADASIAVSKNPDDQSILPQMRALFTVTITNTGDVPLSNIFVSDPMARECRRLPGDFSTVPDLNPGISHTYTCFSSFLVEDLFTEATVTGQPDGQNGYVQASDTAIVRAKHLEVGKNPEFQSVDPGQSATYTITLENTGGFTVTNIAITDPLTPDCERSSSTILPDLGPGESFQYTCQTVPLATDFWNALTATAVLDAGPTLIRRAEAVVEVSSPLEIIKSPDWQVVIPGERATFDLTLHNTGSTSLTNVGVSDPGSPLCDRAAGAIPDLGPGGTYSYTCQSPPLNNDLKNMVTASAQDGGDTVLALSQAYVDASPLVDISVAPAIQILYTNLTATFTVTVSNNSPQLDLIDVSVEAPGAPGCDRAPGILGDLGVSGVISYTCQATIQLTQGLFDMTAMASPFDGDPVFDTATVYAGPVIRYLPMVLKFDAP